MQYLLLIYGSERAWAEIPKDELGKLYGEYFAYTEGIKASGHYIGGNPLQPTSTATTVRVRDGKRSVTDGPFAETKEQLGGVWVIQAPDLDAALAWATKGSAACAGPVEVRPFQEETED